jgi:hypothetical protein
LTLRFFTGHFHEPLYKFLGTGLNATQRTALETSSRPSRGGFQTLSEGGQQGLLKPATIAIAVQGLPNELLTTPDEAASGLRDPGISILVRSSKEIKSHSRETTVPKTVYHFSSSITDSSHRKSQPEPKDLGDLYPVQSVEEAPEQGPPFSLVKDSRRTQRCEPLIDLRIRDVESPASEAYVNDFSEAGIKITGIQTRVGEVKSFVMEGDFHLERFAFAAQCRWTDTTSANPVAGFEILGPSKQVKERLLKLLLDTV